MEWVKIPTNYNNYLSTYLHIPRYLTQLGNCQILTQTSKIFCEQGLVFKNVGQNVESDINTEQSEQRKGIYIFYVLCSFSAPTRDWMLNASGHWL